MKLEVGNIKLKVGNMKLKVGNMILKVGNIGNMRLIMVMKIDRPDPSKCEPRYPHLSAMNDQSQ